MNQTNPPEPSPPGVEEKLRVFVLTDIENEPDDAQSFVRFLTYSNQWDTEAVVATTSCWQQDKIADWRLHEIADAYGEVVENLQLHEPGYPSYEEVKAWIKKGTDRYGMLAVGEGHDSEGSVALEASLEKDDARPLWVLVWGGTNVLAQALYSLRQRKTVAEMTLLLKKLRIYAISDQDDSSPWIRTEFPGLFYIASPGYEENGGGSYHHATWVGISGDSFHGRFQGANFEIVDNPWLEQHIRQNHGPLGAQHPHTKYLLEGDTPTFLYLIANGLNVPERPDYGGWGGRYEWYIPPKQKFHYIQETHPLWTDAVDEVMGVDGNYYSSNQATIWRWREAYQNDFAARMDWTTQSFEACNHPPTAKLTHSNVLRAKAGETVHLSAKDSSDIDGDTLSFNWFHYVEAGTYMGRPLDIDTANESEASFTAPKVNFPSELHIILSVTDDGQPPLTRYQRVIVNVFP